MTEIREKDKLFLALVLPLALAGAYFYGWRNTAVAQCQALAKTEQSLVCAEDYPAELQRAQRQRQAAETELAEERARPQPPARVRGKADAPATVRERDLLKVLQDAGLRITASQDGTPHAARGQQALKASGACDEPIFRIYRFHGSYPQVCTALNALIVREMAVIPEGLTRIDGADELWQLEVWL